MTGVIVNAGVAAGVGVAVGDRVGVDAAVGAGVAVGVGVEVAIAVGVGVGVVTDGCRWQSQRKKPAKTSAAVVIPVLAQPGARVTSLLRFTERE